MKLSILKGIRGQLLVPVIGIICFVLIITSVFSTYKTIKEGNKKIKEYKEEKFEQYKSKLSELVDNAYSVIVYYNKMEKEKKLSKDEAMKRAKDMIRELRYGKDGYYWVDNDSYICQVLPTKIAMEGKNRENLEDANKVKFVKRLVDDAVKNGETYVEYQFMKPNDETPYPKLGHTKYFKEWGWVVGTGFYIDELDKVIIAKEKIVKTDIINKLIGEILSIFILIVIIILAVYKITKPVIKGIEEIDGILYESSKGDLTLKVKKIYHNEIGDIGKSFNIFVEKLNEIMVKVKEGANTIKGSAEEINKANEILAKKSVTQASALEETSATMEEISSIVVINSDKTLEASKLTTKTKEKTEKAGKMSNNLKNSIKEISESSKKIENIIEVIDEIAFQTNLLALNAAVEAARAGEQGRGFAVVAVEVRNLAGRSSKAAKEIKGLIKESVTRVEQGNMQVEETINNMKEIVEEVKKIDSVIMEIASSAEEQKSGVEEINKAIADLDSVTQTNAGIAEETSATTHILNEKAEEFLNKIEFFKTKG